MASHLEVEELLKNRSVFFFLHTDLETFRRIWTVNKEQTKKKTNKRTKTHACSVG